MVKLIVTDIDGTLVEEGNTNLNPEYFDLIRQLDAKGVHFAVATGRPAGSVKSTFGPVLDKIWILSLNGSVIEKNGQTMVPNPVPTEWIREFWEDLSHYPEVDSIVSTANRTICPFNTTPMYFLGRDKYKFAISATGGWDKVPEDEYCMMTLFHPESGEAFVREHHMQEKWAGRMELVPTGQVWVDCLMPGNDKGTALLTLCRKLGIDPADSISFGDNMNDIPLIQAAGVGYAVDNARIEVRNAADRVIPGFAEDGVLREIRRMCKID